MPSPRINLAACLEACGAWMLVLLGGVVLMLALVLGLQRQAVQGMRDARLQIALQDVRERLETDLALGFELAGSARAQSLLEDTLAQDASLVAAEVFDPQGISLFNTDRGSIGERVPESWLTATAGLRAPGQPNAGGRTLLWSASEAGDTAVGTAVLGPFGETSGHISLTSASASLPPARALLLATALLVLALCAVGWIAARRALASRNTASQTLWTHDAAERLRRSQGRLRETLASLGEGGPAS
jgi:hypothetical protein